MNYIVFDIETYSPSDLNQINTEEFRASVVGAYFSWEKKYIAFLEENVTDFIALMAKADLIVGFNQLWFDLPVLQKYADYNLSKLPNYDILVEFQKQAGFKIKLNDLCKANFDDDIKTDSYQQYKDYHKQGKWLELIDYCMNDVRLTHNLFTKILNKEPLKYYDLHNQKEVILNQPVLTKVELEEASDRIF